MNMDFGATLIGYYRYTDGSIFDEFSFPADTFDKALFIKCLLRRWGMQCPYFQDAPYLTSSIGVWSQEQSNNFSMLYEVYTSEYNPIHNYDRYEELEETPDIKTSHTGTDSLKQSGQDVVALTGSDAVKSSGQDVSSLTGSDAVKSSGSDKVQDSGTNSSTKDGIDTVSYSGNFTDTKSSRAYNAGTLTAVDKTVNDRAAADSTTYDTTVTDTFGKATDTTYGKTDTTTYGKTDTTTYGKSDTTTYGKTDTTTYGKHADTVYGHVISETGSRKHKNRMYGNIGVTTTSKMISDELIMRYNFNPYEYIADMFAEEFLSKVL